MGRVHSLLKCLLLFILFAVVVVWFSFACFQDSHEPYCQKAMGSDRADGLVPGISSHFWVLG